jgi:hypothetical protein
MPVRSYSGNAKSTALAEAITATATTFLVNDGTGYPDGAAGPFVVTLSGGTAGEEKVLCATRTGTSFTVAAGGRGFDDTTASAHPNQALVQHTFSATDAREANAHVNATTGDPHPQYLLPSEGDAAYVRTTGGDTITASGAGVTPLVVKGASGQTVSLFEARNAANELRTFVTAGGGVVTRGLLVAGPVDNDGSAQALLVTQDPARRALIVRGAASQTANLAEFQSSAGTVLVAIRSDGYTLANKGIKVEALSAGDPVLDVIAAVSQTANVAQFRNSAGAEMANISADGRARFTMNGAFRAALQVGDPDSAGVGFRTVRVAN